MAARLARAGLSFIRDRCPGIQGLVLPTMALVSCSSPRSAIILRGLAVLSLVAMVDAQRPIGQLTTRALDRVLDGGGSGVLGDVDGDADLDLFVPFASGQDRLFLNDGDGMFTNATAASLPPLAGWSHHAAFGDVDGDGDLDLVVAGNSGLRTQGSQNRLLLNDGSGVFTDGTATRLPGDQDKTSAVAVFDVDGDGDVDLVCGNTVSGLGATTRNRLYLNDGSGSFRDVSATQLPAVNSETYVLRVGDLEGDGDLDFVVVNSLREGALQVHVNDGGGRFSVLPAASVPTASGSGSSLLLFDLEGDGDLDVVAAVGSTLHVLVNDGALRFIDERAARLPAATTNAFHAADFDRDGDVDLCGAHAGEMRLLVNDGTGRFTAGGLHPLLSWAAVTSDVDADGDPDFVSTWLSDVYLNDGRGNFLDRSLAEVRGPELVYIPGRASLGDVDGDGDLDAWIPSLGIDADQLLLNDGRGFFAAAPRPLPRFGTGFDVVAFGDVDGDGDLDAFVSGASPGASTRLLLGDGRGGFSDATASRLPSVAAQVTDLVLADFDGDGDTDLFEVDYGQPGNLWLDSGAGFFVAAPAGAIPALPEASRAAVAFDAEGDGDMDLAIANFGTQPRLYVNDGRGRFQDVSAARLPNPSVLARDVAAADLDGDGDQDLVFVELTGTSRLFLNIGSGRFADRSAGRLPATFLGGSVHAFDRDQDGDIDLLTGTGSELRVFDNDGSGRFVELPRAPTSAVPLAVGDLDGDDDVDVLLGSRDAVVEVATNQRRQLHFGRLARVGRRTSLDVYAVGRAPGADLALPVLAARPARLPVPGLGIVGVDPASAVFGQSITLAQGRGVGRWSFRVPASSSLIGGVFYAQALIVEGSSLLLTNTQSVEIVH